MQHSEYVEIVTKALSEHLQEDVKKIIATCFAIPGIDVDQVSIVIKRNIEEQQFNVDIAIDAR